ncbi:MAG: hypothetical protein J6328_07680 [Bacilli bacterium]|nr:hypothetical protein [Bacilli bacterium]
MKNNKKFVVLAGAAALGLVAATGVTSGFAWFAVNNQVTATSLTVGARSNASYLLSNTRDNASDKTGSDTTIAATTAANTSVKPVSYATDDVTWDKNNTPENTNDDVKVDADNWFTATVDSRNAATPGAGVNYTSLIDVDAHDTNYFVAYTLYLTLATGSEALTEDLTITADFGTSHASVDAAGYLYEGNFSSTTSETHSFRSGAWTIDDVALTESTSVKVTFELYIDGTNANVKSATNIATLIGSIDFTFDYGA